jgi:hypothetical protein
MSEGDLHAWLDGAIPEDSEELRAIRVHMKSCPDCAAQLEDARRLRSEADAILASTLPAGAGPAFEEIRLRSLQEDTPPRASGFQPGPLRVGWLSVQRLGWAASIMLAVGAGWLGRAVLVEKGWTDPFNEGPAPLVSRVAHPEAERAPADGFGRDMDDISGLREEVGRADAPEEANEALQREDVTTESRLEAEAPVSGEEKGRGRSALEKVAEPADDAEVAPSRKGALAQAERQEVDVAAPEGGADAPSAPPEPKYLKTRSVQAPLDPWHAVPPDPYAAWARTTLGCYRLEYSWSPGLAYLPGAIELTPTDATAGSGGRAYRVGLPARVEGHFDEAIWASPGPDSVWVRLITGLERDMLTVRAERDGRDWEGEGRVLSAAAPVSTGQLRGTVRLVSITCDLK